MKPKSIHGTTGKALRKNRKGGIEGLPLQLMIIIMVATLGTAIIVGWMGNIEEPSTIDKVVVQNDDIDLTKVNSTYGATTGSFGPLYRTSEDVVITVYDQKGNPLSGATVVLTGLGVSDSEGKTVHGNTDDNGTVVFKDLTLRMNSHVGYIDVGVSKAGYGENSSCRITVVA